MILKQIEIPIHSTNSIILTVTRTEEQKIELIESRPAYPGEGQATMPIHKKPDNPIGAKQEMKNVDVMGMNFGIAITRSLR